MSRVPYVPLDARGWRLAMQLRPLEHAKWLEVDERRDEELAYRRHLLATDFEAVVATRDEGLDASAELLEDVVEHLRTFHPDLPVTVDPREHPIVAAGRLVQEDLCVLVRDDAWRLQSAIVCFPSRWSLASKIGATLDEIHGPVPLYDVELAHPTNALFDRLRPDRSFWRLNWTLLDDPDLHQPRSPRRSPDGPAEQWWFRVERQTLRRLARSGGIVFTIRTYVASLSELLASDADAGVNLLRALETAPESMQHYKGWIGVAERLRARLDPATS